MGGVGAVRIVEEHRATQRVFMLPVVRHGSQAHPLILYNKTLRDDTDSTAWISYKRIESS